MEGGGGREGGREGREGGRDDCYTYSNSPYARISQREEATAL